MSEPARFELVEGTTFQLSDGSTVTVRDGQLELSDGRRLPMPAAGEAITVEKTVTRPDGSTVRIKHTIRLSETDPVVETPSRPFAGAGPGSDEEDKVAETVPRPDTAAMAVEAVPSASGHVAPATEPVRTADEATNGAEVPEKVPVTDSQLPEVPSQDPAAPVVPNEPLLMGVNCGRRSLREMLWGSIPESGFGEDEEEPKAPPKGLLNKSYSIKEEDESEHEDGDGSHVEALESSENADESFEFVEGKGKDAKKEPESQSENEPEIENASTNEKEPKRDPKSAEGKEVDTNRTGEEGKEPDGGKEAKDKREPEHEARLGIVPSGLVLGDPTTKVTLVTLNAPKKSEPSEKSGDSEKSPTKDAGESSAQAVKPEAETKAPGDNPAQQYTTGRTPGSPDTTGSPASVLDPPREAPADHAADPPQGKPYLTRQEKLLSSGNLLARVGDGPTVRVGVPLLDAADPKAAESPEEGTSVPSSDVAAPAAGPRSDEVHHDLHLKLTPILRSLESDKPEREAAGGDDRRVARSTPGEDRKGTVPPNTPAVAEDREGVLGAEEREPGSEHISVPKVVSYYESISPRGSPAPTRPRDPETTAVPKVIKFAVPMQPEKVYLGSQEPEEMEDTPIPRAAEAPGRVILAPEPAAPRQEIREVLIPVRGTPDDLDPLAALAAADAKPSAPEEKPDEPTTPSTTPEKDATPEEGLERPPQTATESADKQEEDTEKRSPPVYNPALFEPEPKRPLILTSEMVEEDAPPYEPGVHDARTLPIGRKSAVVTEQPPPFGDDDRTDPRDPFLPDNPRPGTAVKADGWLGTCFDLCCCCWAP